MSLERFHFTTADGKELDLPFYQDKVSMKEARKVREAIKAANGSLEDVDDNVFFEAAKLDKKTLDVIENMSLRDYTKFLTGWMEADSGVLGEASAS